MSKEMIVRLNADRVKIKGCEYVQDLIRCKDCKHWENTKRGQLARIGQVIHMIRQLPRLKISARLRNRM